MSVKSPSKVVQDEHLDDAQARKVTQGLLIPGEVLSNAINTAGVLVGKGNICRIEVGVDTFVAFGGGAIGIVSATTSPGIKLKAGVSLVVATDDFIRASAAVLRLEVVAQ